jgi:hypothetical protein
VGGSEELAMERRIDIYVDLKFLEKYFQALNKSDTLSEEFEVYYSFLKVIKQSHIRIWNLESGKMIRPDDIVRVFQSTLRLYQGEKKYVEYNYSMVKNPQSIFFGEYFTEPCNALSNKFGFLFSNFEDFLNSWRTLLLINKRRTIHIQQEPDSLRAQAFWKETLKEYQLPANSIVFVDPYINSWFRPHAKSKIRDNLIEIVSTLLSGGGKQLLVITNSCESWEKSNERGSQGRFERRLINYAIENIPRLSADLQDYDHKIYSFHKETLKVSQDESKGSLSYDVLNNVLHDRYIVTNYFLIISTHSLDIVSEKHEIKKNTQLIIAPLLSQDFFDFYCSKIRSYKALLSWEHDSVLKSYVLTEPRIDVENSHVDYTGM